MEGTIADLFIQAVDTLITALVISFLVILLALSFRMMTIVQENENSANLMSEYREYNAYDNKHVYASDIVSLIMKSKGYPGISVTTTTGTYTFNLSGQSLKYKADILSEYIDPNYIYDANITYTDPTYRIGVEAITFRQCPSSGACGR